MISLLARISSCHPEPVEGPKTQTLQIFAAQIILTIVSFYAEIITFTLQKNPIWK